METSVWAICNNSGEFVCVVDDFPYPCKHFAMAEIFPDRETANWRLELMIKNFASDSDFHFLKFFQSKEFVVRSK